MGGGWGHRYQPGEALRGVPAAAPGARLCLRAAAERLPGGLRSPSGRGCAPLSSGPRPKKLRGDPTWASAWEDGGECTRRPPRPAPRAAPLPGEARLERGKKKNRQGGGFIKNNQQNTGSGRFRFHFCFPLPQPCPHPACPASVPGPRLGSRRLRLSCCREAERRVDPHPSPGERGQVCR